MASLKWNSCLLPVFIWFASHFYSAAAIYCLDGTYCVYDCCYDYDYYYCCNIYSVANAWWFWFIWGFFLLTILLTCCAIIRRRRLRQNHVVVVQHGYNTPTAYGTLVNTENPQQTYVQPVYNQYSGYPQPPPGPAPPYQPAAAHAQPVQQAQAVADKVEHYPNEKPPPYNNPGT